MDANTEKMLYEIEQDTEAKAKTATIAGWIEEEWDAFADAYKKDSDGGMSPSAYSFKEWLTNKLSK